MKNIINNERIVNLDIVTVLFHYPLQLNLLSNNDIVLSGRIPFTAKAAQKEEITDSYDIEITVPASYPRAIPKVVEVSGRLPRNADCHVYSDGSFCLGSDMIVLLSISHNNSLDNFIEKIVIPYLYGQSYRELHGRFPFGELSHGDKGTFEAYQNFFKMNVEACLKMIKLCGKRKRMANKELCPCGSGLKVGNCHNRILNNLRGSLGRGWFKNEYFRLTN